MRTLRILSLVLSLAVPALAGGNRPIELPPCPVGLPDDVHDAINAARDRYLADQDEQRRIAVEMFAKIFNPAADVYLIMIGYADPHPGVRLSAVEALVAREHPKAPILAARLATSTAPRKYRDIGSEIVRKSGSQEAIGLIIEAMRNGTAGFEKVHKVGADAGAQSWGPLIPRTLCARALGRIATPEAVDALVAALRWPEWEIRAAAAQALGEAGDDRAVAPLLKAAEDKDMDVACEAMSSLGRIGGGEAIAYLEKAVKRTVSERDTHYELECWRNDVYVRIAERALKLALAQRAAAQAAPPQPPGGGKNAPAAGGGGGTVADDPSATSETSRPPESQRRAPPEIERDECGEDLVYVCDTTATMSNAKECIKNLVEERWLYRDLASDFRFAFIAFRDFGEQYLTDELVFTRDIEKARDYMMRLGFSGGNTGAGSAAEKALQVAEMLDWSRSPRKRLVLITDTQPNDNEDLYFRGQLLHDVDNVVINALFHTHAATKQAPFERLVKIGGGHADLLPCDKPAGRPRDGAEVR